MCSPPSEFFNGLMGSRRMPLIAGQTLTHHERSFANELCATLVQPEHAAGSESAIQPSERELTMASADVGDVSWNVPDFEPGTAAELPRGKEASHGESHPPPRRGRADGSNGR